RALHPDRGIGDEQLSEPRDVIRGYAQAILTIAETEGRLDQVADELFHFAKAFERSHELRTALTDIAVPAERKSAVIEELLGDRATELTKHIIEFVVSQGRGRELDDIVEQLAGLATEQRAKVLGEVRSAVPLTEELRQQLNATLSKVTGKTVDAKV